MDTGLQIRFNKKLPESPTAFPPRALVTLFLDTKFSCTFHGNKHVWITQYDSDRRAGQYCNLGTVPLQCQAKEIQVRIIPPPSRPLSLPPSQLIIRDFTSPAFINRTNNTFSMTTTVSTTVKVVVSMIVVAALVATTFSNTVRAIQNELLSSVATSGVRRLCLYWQALVLF